MEENLPTWESMFREKSTIALFVHLFAQCITRHVPTNLFKKDGICEARVRTYLNPVLASRVRSLVL